MIVWTADRRALSMWTLLFSNFFTATSLSILRKLHSALSISASTLHLSSSASTTATTSSSSSPSSTLSLLSHPESNTTMGTVLEKARSWWKSVSSLALRQLRRRRKSAAGGLGGLRLWRRGRLRILGLGVGGDGCHLSLLVAVDMSSVSLSSPGCYLLCSCSCCYM